MRPTDGNARRVLAALCRFGFAQVGLSPEDLRKPGQVIQLGVPPVCVDLVTSLDGVTWEQVDGGKVPGRLGDVSVCFVGRAEFVANKRACGRAKDLSDLEALGEKP